ncbi:MAG TPA: hypothetical protein VFC53_03995 [Dehalococcoidia bacterium]|nr:hypothetical protein [Dehalococcoidia bacterium]
MTVTAAPLPGMEAPPAGGREALDYYRTPAAAAERFLEAWAPTVPVPARLDELPDDLRIREYPV